VRSNGQRLEMREASETGCLSLDEWLAMGRASGRGLKLDVKEPQYMDQIVRQVKAAGIPSERLMWNLGDAAMSTWGAKLRQQFPRAVLAINPAGGDDKKISSVDVARLMSLAKRGAGGPVAFVIRYERLTDEAVKALRPYGNISVWSTQGKVSTETVAQVAQQLRERGVDGVIDLQRAPSLVEEKVSYMPESSNPVTRPRVVQ